MQPETTPMLPETPNELRAIIKKQNRLIRFQSTVQTLILILLVGAAIFAFLFFQRVQETIDTVDSKLDEVDIDSLNESIAALDEASAKLEGLDAATINSSVDSLNKASENLSKIDTEQINELTESLNNSAKSIEAVTDKFADIFS